MREAWIILRQCALRHWRLAWRQQLMLLAILALGTAVHVAMRLANQSALAGFERFTETLSRDSDWTLRAAAGPLRMDWLWEMRLALDPAPVTLLPVLEATVVPAAGAGGGIGSRPTWRLLGMDLIALQNLRAGMGFTPQVGELTEDSVFVSEAMAARNGWKRGGRIDLVVDDRVVSLPLGGILPTLPDKPAAPDDLLLMDLSAAQKLLRRVGDLDRVEVLAADGPAFPALREQARARLEQVAGGRWQVIGRDERRSLASGMTAAFRLNLTILSLLALLVGGYLVFQALDGIVIRRREEISILRCLGVTAGSIQMAFLVEAALLGALAGAAGVLLGWAGAQGAVRGVAVTMTALYGASSANYSALTMSELLLGVGLSVGTSLVAACLPARAAAATPPALAMGRHAVAWQGGNIWQAEWLGLLLAALAVGLSQLGPWHSGSLRVPLGAYAAALLWLLGVSLAASGLLKFLWQGGDAVRGVALSYLRMPSLRHRLAVAALTSAVAMTAGMAIMIASFDHTMRSWIERSMKADVYASSAGAQSVSSTHSISAETVAAMRSQPEVAEISTVQYASITLPDGPSSLIGSDADYAERHRLHVWVQAPPVGWWRSAEVVGLMNESLSTRLNRTAGDVLAVPTPGGLRQIKIVGVYADYGNERGSVMIPQARFREWFQHDRSWRVAMMLRPGADAQTLTARLQAAYPGLSLFTQAHLRSEALRIFRQTFAITYALEAVGVVVAVAGLGLALAGLMLDRRADLTTLRAVGFSAGQLARACAWEGFGLGLVGVLAGGGSGVWLGWLLIARVNKQAFGWTLTFAFPWWQMLALIVAVLSVGTAVAALVGRWSSKLKSEKEE